MNQNGIVKKLQNCLPVLSLWILQNQIKNSKWRLEHITSHPSLRSRGQCGPQVWKMEWRWTHTWIHMSHFTVSWQNTVTAASSSFTITTASLIPLASKWSGGLWTNPPYQYDGPLQPWKPWNLEVADSLSMQTCNLMVGGNKLQFDYGIH